MVLTNPDDGEYYVHKHGGVDYVEAIVAFAGSKVISVKRLQKVDR